MWVLGAEWSLLLPLCSLYAFLPGKSSEPMALLPLASPSTSLLSSLSLFPSLPSSWLSSPMCVSQVLGHQVLGLHNISRPHVVYSLSLQGQFCWTNLWNGIKTSRCPRTLCIAARESLLPRLCHPLAINCCLYWSACCFSCTVCLSQGVLVFAVEWAALLDV